MADLKKKFIDILFEEDDPEKEVLEDSYYSEPVGKHSSGANNTVTNNNVVNDVKQETVKNVQHAYRRGDKSAFIDLKDSKKEEAPLSQNKIKEEYEMSSQLSPIFGVIKENKRREITIDKNIEEYQTNKPSDSHLDIITSPIYGYGNKEDAIKDNYEVKNIIDDVDEDELHHLFDEEEYLDDSYDKLNNDSLSEEDISLFRLFGDNK